jgi:hypothetical protein
MASGTGEYCGTEYFAPESVKKPKLIVDEFLELVAANPSFQALNTYRTLLRRTNLGIRLSLLRDSAT